MDIRGAPSHLLLITRSFTVDLAITVSCRVPAVACRSPPLCRNGEMGAAGAAREAAASMTPALSRGDPTTAFLMKGDSWEYNIYIYIHMLTPPRTPRATAFCIEL